MAEFCDSSFLILCVTPEGYREYTLCELLPYAFTPENVAGESR
jgi:cytidine deaminase